MNKTEIELLIKDVIGVKKDLVGLKALKEIPEDIPPYEGLAVPGMCAQIGEILKSGDVFYSVKENNSCFEGLIATGVCEISVEAYRDEVEAFIEISPYHKDVKTAMDYYDKAVKTIPLPPVENACLVTGPLSKVDDPDLVLIFCNPKQAEVLIRSQSYFGNIVRGFGGGGGCIYNIRYSFHSGEPSFSNSDYPWRMFVGLDDDELTVTFPYDTLVQSAPMIKPIVDYFNTFSEYF